MSGRVSPAPTSKSRLWMTMERVRVHAGMLDMGEMALAFPTTRPETYLDISMRGAPPLTPGKGFALCKPAQCRRSVAR